MAETWLNNLEKVRAVEWGKGYLWDIRFPAPGGPPAFQDWFPATEIEENLWSLTTHEINIGNTTVEVPKGTSVFTLSVTFMETMRHDISSWLTAWVNAEILPDGKTGLLENIVKQVDIRKLDGLQNTVHEVSYLVFPKDELMFSGTSDDAALTDQIAFVIAGTL